MSLSVEDLGFEDISDKIIILTGASNGMGRAAALLLSKAGARLGLMSRRKERLESLSQEIQEYRGHEPLLIVGDVRKEQDCMKAITICSEHYTRIDVLINNAGVGYPSDLEKATTEE